MTEPSARGGAPPAAAVVPATRLADTMETMFPAGRRSLPPVPRRPDEVQPAGSGAATDLSHVAGSTPAALLVGDRPDGGQDFVARLRAAAGEFAGAAGAQGAVVREAVPPARHRRSRCRVVLRFADGSEADLAFLGPAGRPDTGSGTGFEAAIQQWLGAGQHREAAWMVRDDDAADGWAVDVTAWLAGI